MNPSPTRSSDHPGCFETSSAAGSFPAMEYFTGDPSTLLGRGQQVILFVDSSAEDTELAIERFAAMPWPRGTHRLLVDARASSDAVGWFGIREFPTVAIVRDGAVLALEARCDDSVCRQLLAVAGRRHPACLES